MLPMDPWMLSEFSVATADLRDSLHACRRFGVKTRGTE